MRRFALPLFIAVAVAAVAFVITTSGALPERVASHFVLGGKPDGWMTREAYLLVILLAATLLPLVIVVLMAGMARVFPRLVNLPNRDYWLATERREAALAALADFGWGFASLVTLFVAGMHWTILDANASVPPRLAEAYVDLLVAASFVAIAAWIIALYLYFRRPA
jgi:uncharacterized membrane protein